MKMETLKSQGKSPKSERTATRSAETESRETQKDDRKVSGLRKRFDRYLARTKSGKKWSYAEFGRRFGSK
jgi:hypothetical protein